ncbi:phosphatidylglycerophosphatase B [Candidatus Hoaglandella endobia]|uniref:undecaprenyl-diphosphate phosphatase n=1 Tax=Candidatus Hoaglandella endobia TaxID=1778263 RepID=A0A143WTB3_9ENTR|nr:phosphatidylglycerophosphatase B [Candidatus Hoaglandella endobia]CUX96987.1 Phosphatidylglycerophosphatase B [Candidatus Hoaglandella endobia]
MFLIAKRTGIGALLLIILPLLLWVSGWQWQSGSDYRWLIGLYWLTQTVTSPWGILTSILLISWFFWCLPYRLKPALALVVILATTLLVGQGMKSFIKDRVQTPRPFVVWLDKHYSIDDQAFYAMTHKERSEAVAHELQSEKTIPTWLQHHWRHETGFSFPSGHTIFAASWALFSVGLLWPTRHVVTILVLLVWASGVMISRIWMGLHWPQDVMMSVVVSWFIITLACWLIQCWIGTLKPEKVHGICNRR